MRIDAHHHLWDLKAVQYHWLMERGARRFFGDPAPIQRDYLIDEFRGGAEARGFKGSIHVQVGAADGLQEALWVQNVADANPDWPIAQVAFCDLTHPELGKRLDKLQALTSVRGVRQIVGRAPDEDLVSGTNTLLDTPAFADGLRELGKRGLSFDLQLIPELMTATARLLEKTPDTKIALCHAGSPHDRSSEGIANYSKQLRSLSALPQVTCKLSGLGMFDHAWTVESIRPIVHSVLDQFGPQRCMFGSNFPVDHLYSDYDYLVNAYEAVIPENDWSLFFSKVAREFYRMG